MNDEENPQLSVGRPPRKTRDVDRSLRAKMIMLIGLLLLVFYTMHEAGKPKNWAWMGFPDGNNGNSSIEHQGAVQPLIGGDSTGDLDLESSDSSPPPRVPASSTAIRTGENSSTAIRIADLSPTLPRQQREHPLPAQTQKFWRMVFRQLSSSQQLEFLVLLDRFDTPANPNRPLDNGQTSLVQGIIDHRREFADQQFDRVTALSNKSDEKKRASDEYFTAEKFWDQQISMVLRALIDGDDITLTQQRNVGQLKKLLEAEALQDVQDNTAIGWTGDSIGWKRCWRQLHRNEIVVEKAEQVKRIQLIAQPDQYRGRVVNVRGFVRAIQFRSAEPKSSINPNEAPAEYYIAWVKPVESEAGPYCVYCTNLPAEIPFEPATLKKFDRVVDVTGIFFKNRSYPAASGEVLASPLILAASVRLQPSTAADVPLLSWLPGAGTVRWLVWLVPATAIAGTWLVFRAARTRKRLPGKKRQQQLQQSLDELKESTDVQTVQEKVQSIAERLDES